MRSTRIATRIALLAAVALAAGGTPAAAQHAMSPADAARFLTQATLGADWDEIHRTAEMGREAWLDEQFARPIGYHRPYLDQRTAMGLEVNAQHRRWAWWQQVMDGPDPLRQRVGLALSEHFVVSDNHDAVGNNPHGLAAYYDMLLEHAFGNYRDLLRDVSLHPIMGAYLSHLRNRRSSGNRFPDENYAREIMQLFSIGLFELNPDGTEKLDGQGRPIPSYDNDDITELAKVFTGLSFSGADNSFDQGLENWTEPMRMYEAQHEPGAKFLLRGRFIPAGQTGMQDIEDAIDSLFEHPNVGPFVARRLIQRMVMSNPSPGYVERVAAAFADNGAGVRGDMQATIRAILLDPEARQRATGSQIGRGMLRESYLRRVHLARIFDADDVDGEFRISDNGADITFAQRPLSSPTVFNFFLPDHQPAGPIADANLYGPEFQIITAVTAITSANALRSQIEGTMNNFPSPALEVDLDFTDEIAMASNIPALLDRLNLLMMHGSMSVPMRQILVTALQQIDDPEERVHTAVHLISISPSTAS